MAGEGDDDAGMVLLPLEVGSSTYAVKLPRVATVLRTGVLGDVTAGDVVDLAEHRVALTRAADFLGETPADETAIVVFHGRDGDGCVPGWLVDDVGEPTTVDGVETAVGAMRAVRGRVEVDSGDAILLDPDRIHAD